MSKVKDSLKCHMNVTKKTNHLQVNSLITNKSVTITEAPGKI
jgi:hypothetical protein